MQQQQDTAEWDRRVRMAQALAAYDGDGPKPLKVRAGEPDDNVAVNYAAVIVDKAANFLFGKDLKIEIGTESDNSGEAYLDEVWPSEQRSEDLIDLGTNGAIFGHAWVRIAITADGHPRVVIPDPLNLSAQWAADDWREIIRYRHEYNTTDGSGTPVICREDTDREGDHWVIRQYRATENSRNFERVGEDVIWPWQFAPILHCKNLPRASEFYGRPDLTRDILTLISALARVDSLINRIIRLHGYPKTIARGMRVQDLQIGVDGTLFLPSLDAQIANLEMQSDLAASMNFRKQLREALAELSQVPEVATSKMEHVGQLSGRALQILYGPLIERTQTRRRLYGRLLKDLIQALLVVGRQTEQPVTLHWPDLIPGDEKETAETLLLLKQLGVSEDSILRKLGYDPEAEKLKRQAETSQAATAMMDAFNQGA
ncbi:MAG: phage portal protein [Blastocatellia bacterium]